RSLSTRMWALWLAAAVALAGALAMAQTAQLAARATVKPIPAITGHMLSPTLSFPPTTSQCLQMFGIHCYQPFQIRKHYDLAPLLASGITGAGRTIVIVDSFGSPTIRHDLQVFDQTFDLPDPVLDI